MAIFAEQTIEVAGRRSRLLRAGKKDAPAAVFLHGAIPGVAPYCGGAHLWGECLTLFEDRDVVVLDLPGSGGTAAGSSPLTIDILGQHVLDTLSALSIGSADIVGHEVGGLVGLWLALQEPTRVRSLSNVASSMSPPTSDGLDNLLLHSPPQPLWGRESQAWALDRLSYSHAHIDTALLDACVAAGKGEAHQTAAKSMNEGFGRAFAPSMNRTKYQLWEACRNDGLKVPVQIVWGSHDPTTTREAGFVLFNAIAAKQPATQFHVINRAGSFPFREQPQAFHHIVSAFQAGALQEASRSAA